MSLKLSFPEKTNLYLTNLNNKSKIDVLIPDGILKCDESNEDFYINVIQFNTLHNFYHVIEGYNNNFNIIIDNDTIINGSIPTGNINAYTIREYINNHNVLKNHIYIVYDKFKNTFEFQKISDNSLQLEIINAHTLLGFSKTESIMKTCARRRQRGWFVLVSGLPWGLEPHDIPIGEQWGGWWASLPFSKAEKG